MNEITLGIVKIFVETLASMKGSMCFEISMRGIIDQPTDARVQPSVDYLVVNLLRMNHGFRS